MDPASSIIPSIILYVLFILLSAYFAASETAYTAVSKVRMRTRRLITVIYALRVTVILSFMRVALAFVMLI